MKEVGNCRIFFSDVKLQIKNQPSGEDGDPDSRMETERMDRRDKKAAKGKGLRGSSKSGGQILKILSNLWFLTINFRFRQFLEAMKQARGVIGRVGCS